MTKAEYTAVITESLRKTGVYLGEGVVNSVAKALVKEDIRERNEHYKAVNGH